MSTLPLHVVFPSPIQSWKLGNNVRAWKYTGGTQWGSSSLAHSSLLLSLISFIAVLRTITGSGCHMPSTCPNELILVEHWESHSSMVFLGKSMSHSRVLNSARAEWEVWWTLVYSLWHKAVGAPWGMATRKSQLWRDVYTLPLQYFVSYEDKPFVTWCAISYSTSSHWYSIFLFPRNVLAFVQTTSPSLSWTVLANL